jgi:hypothetical protein
MTKLYYHAFTPHIRIEESPMCDLLYDLEQYSPPHKQTPNLSVNLCPALTAFDNQSFVLRSPLDIHMVYDTFKKSWQSNVTPTVKDFILIEKNSSIFQLAFYYLFWQDKQSDTQLFMYDAPLYALTSLPNFYVTSGMIPIGQYTRNTGIGIVPKDLEKPIKIKRGQALASITAFSSQKIQLIKQKPPQSILDTNQRHLFMKSFCPYTMSKKLFSRWL